MNVSPKGGFEELNRDYDLYDLGLSALWGGKNDTYKDGKSLLSLFSVITSYSIHYTKLYDRIV